MQLTIDIGNSTTKIAVYQKDKQISSVVYETVNQELLTSIIRDYNIRAAIVSSVGKPNAELISVFNQLKIFYIYLDATTPLPFDNQYKSSTIGTDRLAAIAGAQMFYGDKDVLVIDAGTAITYDYLNANGVYIGGNISPGIDMRFKALHNFTAKLPLIEKNQLNQSIGSNTEEAILTGVIQGVVYEVERYVDEFLENTPSGKIFFTGGDTKYFVKILKNSIFVEPFLVLLGLNQILLHNVKNKNIL